MTILVAADFDDDEWSTWWPLLVDALPGERLTRSSNDDGEAIDVAIVANPASGALAGLPSLALVQSLWAGVERLLADPTVPAGVPLARMVDPAMADTMAETALWATLAVHRNFFDYAQLQRSRAWQQLPLRRADEVPVAVLGVGAMGRAVARRLVGNAYPVTVWQREASTSVLPPGVRASRSLADALRGAEVVIDLMPLTPATRGILDANAFASMRPGATLVNLARGAHVVEADLLAALDRGHLRRAVLDVFAEEPLPSTHPYWSHPGVVVLPHVAAPTDPRSAVAIAARNVRALREGRPIENPVDRKRGY